MALCVSKARGHGDATQSSRAKIATLKQLKGMRNYNIKEENTTSDGASGFTSHCVIPKRFIWLYLLQKLRLLHSTI